jgi:membrane protein YdbS with pleckstrin-like domain
MDAWLNAALVITGNGPIAQAQSVSGKAFMFFYALGGVLIFAAVISVVMAPILHRMLHAFHAELPDEMDGQDASGGGD